jgi:glycosyltransferase involved in cell wall biosynthesis
MDKRRVGIDGISLHRKDSGIEVYAHQLVRGLLEGGNFFLEIYSYTQTILPPSPNLTVKSSNMRSDISAIKKIKWQLFDINSLIPEELDIFHSPHFIVPYNNKSYKKIITIHDLAFLKYPSFFDWKTKLYYKLFLKRSLQAADAIICISESCLQDVATFFPFTKDKVARVYHGYKDFSVIHSDASVLGELKIGSSYILMVGALNPRKNIWNAIQAFKKVSAGRDMELVIVGNKPQYIDHSHLADPRIKFTGYITENQMSALYRHALLLLYPSFYEGFGFPILEAMSAGLPVVTANNSSLPEVSGYSTDLLCDAANVNSIVRSIEYYIMDSNRAALVAHGYKNIPRFSWKKMIQETEEVYDQV